MDTSKRRLSLRTSHEDSSNGFQEAEVSDRALLRRIDWRILPIMFLTYFLQFLDKVCLNYANVMGIQADLNMSGNDFSWLATGFFIAFAIAEIPQAFLLQKYTITKVLGWNIVIWGIVLCCSAAAQNYAGLLALRILLGIAEAVIAPALTVYTSMWYTRAESTPRFGLWYCGLGSGQIVGGLVSFGAQHAPESLSLEGWRIMFLVIGAVNIIAAILVLTCLPTTLETAYFLSESEKTRLAQRLVADSAGAGPKVFHYTSLLSALTDAQTWLLSLLTILSAIPSGLITTFSSILIRGFGYTSKESALLNTPSGAVSILSIILSTYAIAKGYDRWLVINILFIPTLVGSCLISFLPEDNQAGCLVGIYMVNTTVAPYALILAWAGANYKTYTMKVSGLSFISGAFSIANIIGPQTFQARDAPDYLPAKITIVAVNASGIVISTVLRFLYGARNANAERVGGSAKSLMERKIAKGGDEEGDSRFRVDNQIWTSRNPPTIWDPEQEAPASGSLSYPEFMQHARHIVRVQTGEVSCAHEYNLDDLSLFCTTGDFTVWAQDTGQPHNLHWQSLRDRSQNKVQTVLGSRLLRAGGSLAFAEKITLNKDGILMVSLGVENDSTLQRTAVYSLVQGKILWHCDLTINPKIYRMPVLLGESRVYVRSWGHSERRWMLEAYDFRTRRRLYTSPVLCQAWRPSPLPANDPEPLRLDYSLIEAKDGEELVLQASSPLLMSFGQSDIRIDVIKGSDGQLIRRIDGPELHVVSHPTSSQIAFITTIIIPSQILRIAHPILANHAMFIIRRCAYSSPGGLSELYTDAVMVPDQTPVVLSPFHMTAFVTARISSATTRNWTLLSCPLIPADDTDMFNAAAAAVEEYSTAYDGITLRHCYILGNGTTFTLPPDQAQGNLQRSDLVLGYLPNIYYKYLFPNGRFVFWSGGIYDFDFS
ncbi:major facilitator superfamily domain-containing protein [Aspergillus californicus]